MRKLFDKLRSIKKEVLIKNSFLLPILLVVIMSISHVVSWYDLGNPISWAIYLSVAVEIFALASVSAASININRGSVWFLFSLVTSIQIIGNIFFEFNDIDVSSKLFQSWVELVQPFFEDWSVLDHKRLLAIIQGGTLPLMSLTALHYYIKFGDKMREKQIVQAPAVEEVKPVVIANTTPVEDTPKVEEKPIEKKEDDDDIAKYTNSFE